MADRESQKSAEELAHEHERFDIHVMAFAQRSDQVVTSLQSVFALDRATARGLLEGTPLVVKRAAPPDVADALFAVLERLGAQVVLLPTPASPELAAQLEAALRGEVEGGDASVEKPIAGWGALDLELQPRAQRAVQAARLAPKIGGLDLGEDDPFARELKAAQAAVAEDADADLEFDLGGIGADIGSGLGSESESESVPGSEYGELSGLAIEPTAHSVRRPSLQDPPAVAPRAPAARALPDLGLGSVPPLPALPAPRPQSPSPPAPHARATLREAAPQPRRAAVAAPRAAPAPAPARTRARPAPAPAPAPRPAPQQAPAPAFVATPLAEVGVEAGRSRLAQRLLELGPSVALPALDVEVGRERRPGTARSPAAEPAAPVVRARDAAFEVNTPIDTSLRPRSALVRESPTRRARSVAVIELLGGALVVYLGLRMGNSVLHGNASAISVLLHGLAFYGMGSGLLGLRP